MQETADSIAQWIDDTFGESTRERSSVRANEEMAELLTAVHDGSPAAKVIDECADVVICLVRVCAQHGGDLFTAIEHKMEVNRSREWSLDGTGCGYHVKDV